MDLLHETGRQVGKLSLPTSLADLYRRFRRRPNGDHQVRLIHMRVNVPLALLACLAYYSLCRAYAHLHPTRFDLTKPSPRPTKCNV